MRVFIHVTWMWLALPIALEVFAVVFLLAVILQSCRRDVRAVEKLDAGYLEKFERRCEGEVGRAER
jgi:hypothetical protein